jgi:hypothetical protein
MPLKFPNARLLIHDFLLSGLSGKEAIVRGACEYGLISPDFMTEEQVPDSEPCQCLGAAKNVLCKYFESKKNSSDMPLVNIEAVLSAFESEALAYRKTLSLPPVENCELGKLTHDSRFAPAIFDIMLQQMRRYS